MTSSQPVTTPNALNFTPDNKGVYAYSGLVAVTDSETNLVSGSTNSEYLQCKILFSYGADTVVSDDYIYRIRLNDIVIWQIRVPHVEAHYQQAVNINIIIPPFTDVRLTAENATDGSAHNQIVIMAGSAVGMTDTGYQ